MSAAIIAKVRRYGKADGFDNVTTYPDADISEYIAEALEDVPTSRLGVKADRAVAYYTAHLMFQASSGVGGGGGSKKKEKTRNVEVEYHAVTTGAGEDKYYNLYLKLIGPGRRPTPFVMNGGTP